MCSAQQASRTVEDLNDDDEARSLIEYISQGPLLASTGISHQEVEANIDTWIALGDLIISNLQFPPRAQLQHVQRLRIYQYYLPVFFWCQRQLADHRVRHPDDATRPPLVIGISAPQGCGKTTLVEQLEALFQHTGCCAAGVSIDDFYLTFQDQQRVAQQNPDNRLLQLRGNAGSHDVQLGSQILTTLKETGSEQVEIALPRYDKSKQEGRGDRAAQADWPRVRGPVDVVLFEGWMLGFRPLPTGEVEQVDADLVTVNEVLRDYENAWDLFVDAWLVVRVQDPSCVYSWRLQAEHAMRASGRPGMTDEQVADFVDRYMPAYKAYLPTMYDQGPTTAKAGKLLVIEIDETRTPIPQQPAAIM